MNTNNYENAPATLMLATHCCVCGRPLVDAVSVNTGIGPDCREKSGFNVEVSEDARARANKLVYQIALGHEGGVSVLEAATELHALGFDKLANKVIERTADIRVENHNGILLVYTPYNESATSDWRAIPGRQWDKEAKCNRVPLCSKAALYRLLQKHFDGLLGYGPKGPFVVHTKQAD